MPEKPESETRAGWGHPGLATKWHYFALGEWISICGRWGYTGVRMRTEPLSACASCTKKLARQASLAERRVTG